MVRAMKFMMMNFGETLLGGEPQQQNMEDEQSTRAKKRKKKGKKVNTEEEASEAKDSRPMYKPLHDVFVNFLDSDDCEVNVADEEQEFLEVLFEVALDSGAGEHVASSGSAPGYRLEESWGSRIGQNLVVPGATRLKIMDK